MLQLINLSFSIFIFVRQVLDKLVFLCNLGLELVETFTKAGRFLDNTVFFVLKYLDLRRVRLLHLAQHRLVLPQLLSQVSDALISVLLE